MTVSYIILLCIWIISFAIITVIERYNGRTYEDYGYNDAFVYTIYTFIIAPIALFLVCCLIGYSMWTSKHKEKHNKLL